MSAEPRVALDDVHVLAEGPVWDRVRERVLWVDIRRGLVLAARLRADDTLELDTRLELPSTVGCVAVAEDGTWVIADAEGLLVREPGDAPRPWVRVLSAGGTRRLNDGKPDPAGRFVVGSLSLAGPSTTEELVAVDADGTVRVLDDDLTLSNGLAWTADGRRLFSVDTFRQTIAVRDYDPVTGDCGAREVFVTLDEGYPDGICLDAEGYLWVAVWGGGAVHRYAPDGALARVLPIPAPHVSSVAFAGADLDVLVVTTASDELDADRLAAFPDSGRLFTCRPGVTGLPVALWRTPDRSKES